MTHARDESQLPVRAVGPSPAVARSTRDELDDLPGPELDHLAEQYGLDPTRHEERVDLVNAIRDRRALIAKMDREAMLDVVRWARRPVSVNANREQLAFEIAHVRSMRFGGLSQRGLAVLAMLRGCDVEGDEDVPDLVAKLKRREGFLGKMGRKRRALIGSMIGRVIGDHGKDPTRPTPALDDARDDIIDERGRAAEQEPEPSRDRQDARARTIKHEIEEAGLIGGIASRVRRSADTYVNQKLDEIESRIDRKLDEIDRRLADWRDKEIANRIRILKITLWASVIVASLALVYAYVKVNFLPD